MVQATSPITGRTRATECSHSSTSIGVAIAGPLAASCTSVACAG